MFFPFRWRIYSIIRLQNSNIRHLVKVEIYNNLLCDTRARFLHNVYVRCVKLTEKISVWLHMHILSEAYFWIELKQSFYLPFSVPDGQ